MKYYVFILLLFLFSYTNKKNDSADKGSQGDQKVIVIQPLGDFKPDQAEKVFTQIRAVNPNVVLRQNISFPEHSFYKPRNRYRADSIIKNLKDNIGSDSVIVGLSHFDISTTKNSIKDWGIMGLGYNPGKACVVSDFRLSVKNKNAQFYKLVLHELGHTEGLPHCKTKSCVMFDAQGGNPFEEEKSFCRECKSFLKIKAGS